MTASQPALSFFMVKLSPSYLLIPIVQNARASLPRSYILVGFEALAGGQIGESIASPLGSHSAQREEIATNHLGDSLLQSLVGHIMNIGKMAHFTASPTNLKRVIKKFDVEEFSTEHFLLALTLSLL